MGYSILSGATDLDLSGTHGKLDKNCRIIISTWVILMPSERAQASRRVSSANWAQTHAAATAHAPQVQLPQPQAFHEKIPFDQYQSNVEPPPIVVPIIQSNMPPQQFPQPPAPQSRDLGPQNSQASPPLNHISQSSSQAALVPQLAPSNGPATGTTPKSIEERLDDVARDFNEILIPQSEKLLSYPPTDPNARLFEYRRVAQHIERGVIAWLDGFPIPEGHPARKRRKEMIIEAQQLLQSLDVASKPPSASSTPSIASTPSVASHPHSAVFVPKVTPASTNPAPAATNPFVSLAAVSEPSPGISPLQQSHPMSPISPPPYSPDTPPSTVSAGSSTTPAGYPFPAKKPIRRKAPPPPKKFISAKALYDFEPEEDNDEELAFKEGDDVEIIEKTAALEEEGWCRARVKGSKKLGLVPLEYLEIEEKPPTLKPTAPSTTLSAPSASVAYQPHHELHGSEAQTYYGTTSVDHPSEPGSIGSTIYDPSSHHSYSSGYPPSSYPTNYSDNSQMHISNSQQSHHTSKMGKKMEIAGLAVATAGAAAGIATYVQQVPSSDPQPTGADGQQQQPTTENVTINEQDDPTENIQNTYDTTNSTQTTVDPTIIITTPPLAPVADIDNSPPQIADLSAYSASPFDPQPSTLTVVPSDDIDYDVDY